MNGLVGGNNTVVDGIKIEVCLVFQGEDQVGEGEVVLERGDGVINASVKDGSAQRIGELLKCGMFAASICDGCKVVIKGLTPVEEAFFKVVDIIT